MDDIFYLLAIACFALAYMFTIIRLYHVEERLECVESFVNIVYEFISTGCNHD